MSYTASRRGNKITVTWATLEKGPRFADDGIDDGADTGDWFEMPKAYRDIEVTINGAIVNPEVIMEGSTDRESGKRAEHLDESTGKKSRIGAKGQPKKVSSRPQNIRPKYNKGQGPLNVVMVVTI